MGFTTDTFIIINSSSTKFTKDSLGAYYYNNNFDFGAGGKPEYSAHGTIKTGTNFSDFFGLITAAWLYVGAPPYPGGSPTTTLRFSYYIPSLSITNEYSLGVNSNFYDTVIAL